MREVR